MYIGSEERKCHYKYLVYESFEIIGKFFEIKDFDFYWRLYSFLFNIKRLGRIQEDHYEGNINNESNTEIFWNKLKENIRKAFQEALRMKTVNIEKKMSKQNAMIYEGY